MIKSTELAKALDAIEEAKRIVKIEIPNATFMLDGIDEQNIYFSLTAKLSEVTKPEMEDIKETTRFVLIEENKTIIYSAKFSMSTEYNNPSTAKLNI